MNTKFDFSMPIYKAVEKEGEYFIFAKASDNMVDRHGDRMSSKALKMMAKAAKDGVPLRRSHDDSFEIGMTVDGKLRKSGDRIDFIIKAKLDMDYPESRKLFDEVESRKAKRQLSIGGFIPIDAKDAIDFEETKDGIVRVINMVELDHIAVTAPNFAANPRTGFVDAIIKSLGGIEMSEKKKDSAIDCIEKGVVHFKSYPLADRDKSWSFTADDGNAILLKFSGKDSIEEFNSLPDDDPAKREGFMWYKEAHAWFDEEMGRIPMRRADYGLPHHKLDDDGEFKTFFRGVVAAIASVNGARGGFRRFKSEDERRMAYQHLARHIREYGAEPPELVEMSDNIDETKVIEDLVKHFEEQNIDVSFLYKEFGIEKTTEQETSEAVEQKEEETVKDTKVYDLIYNLCEKLDLLNANLEKDKEEPVKPSEDDSVAIASSEEDAAEEEAVAVLDFKSYVDRSLVMEVLKSMNECMDALKKSLELIEQRCKELESRYNKIEQQFNDLESKLEKIAESFEEKLENAKKDTEAELDNIKKHVVPQGNVLKGQEDEMTGKSKRSLDGLLFGNVFE